jgi:hypothetical protein
MTFFLAGLRDMPDPAAGRAVRWSPMAAGTAAVLMALNHNNTLYAGCDDALACMAADCIRQRRVGRTYNGLVKAIERQAPHVLPLLKTDLRRQARPRMERIPNTAGWRLLAVDGSKTELPRTRDNDRVFGIADNGPGPQAFVTTVVEVRTGLPLDWRIDRADAAEKTHLIQMAPDLPHHALLLADGNFVGFPIWSRLDRLDQPFLIRVGGNVRLLENLWPDAQTCRDGRIVYAWPKRSQKHHAPLTLRLIRVGSGKKAVHLLTNVLDPDRLSKRTAGEIYRLRWGVELFYRTLKRTFGYVKLRSKAGRRARLELEWGLIAMMIATMIGIDALTRRRLNPNRLSPAHLLRSLRKSLHRDTPTTPAGNKNPPNAAARTRFTRNIAAVLKDVYHRHRPKRSRLTRITTNTPKTHRLRPPIVRQATPEERKRARIPLSKHAA